MSEKVKRLFLASTLLALLMTALPIAILAALYVLGLTEPIYIILWLLLALLWMVFTAITYMKRSIKA